mgnify:CR=1 FL=1
MKFLVTELSQRYLVGRMHHLSSQHVTILKSLILLKMNVPSAFSLSHIHIMYKYRFDLRLRFSLTQPRRSWP